MFIKKMHLIYVVLVLGLAAAGCGAISLPKDPKAYQAIADEQGHVFVTYSYSFQKQVQQDQIGSKLHEALIECIGYESCGAMARVRKENGETSFVSSSCSLAEQGNKIDVKCTVPFDSKKLKYSSYTVRVTVVAPDNADFTFDSSPEISITKS